MDELSAKDTEIRWIPTGLKRAYHEKESFCVAEVL